jgi:hypothetical protein
MQGRAQPDSANLIFSGRRGRVCAPISADRSSASSATQNSISPAQDVLCTPFYRNGHNRKQRHAVVPFWPGQAQALISRVSHSNETASLKFLSARRANELCQQYAKDGHAAPSSATLIFFWTDAAGSARQFLRVPIQRHSKFHQPGARRALRRLQERAQS